MSRFFEFGEFRFDAEKKVLRHRDENVALPPKATDVLYHLIREHGELVERDRLVELVWHDTVVEEGNLNNAVSSLRKVLGSDGIIQTVPRRGYRFTADVREMPNGDELTIERRTVSHTRIEAIESSLPDALPSPDRTRKLVYATIAAVVLAATAGAVWFLRGSMDGNTPPSGDVARVIVVLPFRSLTGANSSDALAEGITENLATRLGSVEQLVVRPPATARRLANEGADPIDVGKKLGADAVIDGSYQTEGGRIRLMVRLVNVADGAQMWSATFDESESDLFKLQDSLASQAAARLTKRLTPQQQIKLAARPTENVDAYNLYVRARHLWNKRTRESLLESIPLFQAAIDADPTFAIGYAGLADSYVVLNDYAAARPNESYPKAKAAAMRALELDPTLVQPRVTLAYVLATYDWNYAAAEKEYRQAIEQSPNYATAHQWYGEMLCLLERYAEAETEFVRADELDPLVPIIQSELGVNLYYIGNYQGAIDHFAKVKNDNPAFPTSYIFSARAHEMLGQYDQAFENEIEYWRLMKLDDATLDSLRAAYQEGGREKFLRRLTAHHEQTATNEYFYEYRLVHLYARLRDREQTLKWLERGVENRSASIPKVSIDPNFSFLSGDPRYQSALARMNLVDGTL